VYPYGTTHAVNKCNDAGKNPMVLYHPPGGRGWPGWNLEELNDPRNDVLEGTVAKTGAFPGCLNDWGAFDMVGNLHEWTSDPNGTFQGGYFLDTMVNGEGCAYRTTAHHFRYHDYSTGFRCCAALK
jgi:formylglycine-generating enzyme required for sulfatase activity